MKKILLSSVALVGLTAGALAADLPSRRAPAPYVSVPVFTWTGFYVGVNAGYGFGTGSDRAFGQPGNLFSPGIPGGAVLAPGGAAFATGNRSSRDGFVGGGQVGYNYQVGSFVIGVEGDIQYTDFGSRRAGTFATAIPGGTIAPVGVGAPGNVAFFARNANSDFYGTVRGRLGYAIDRTLLYVTGGGAFRDVSNLQSNYFGFNNVAPRKGDTVGYTVGGGDEYAFTPNVTGRLEAFYTNFGSKRTVVNGGTLVGVTNTNAPIVAVAGSRHDDDFVTVRAGVNYKFTTF